MMGRQQSRVLMSLVLGSGLAGLLQVNADAMPMYSRRYDLKCSACHTIEPALNQMGWMFKRLGYHLPPALTKGQKAPSISDQVKKEAQWTLADNLSIAVADFSFQTLRSTQEGATPTSSSAFQVNSWNNYAGGWVPDTNFFYLAEFDIITNGSVSPDLSNAYFGYSGGSTKSSWYLAGGREHLQIGEGTRAAQVYSLLLSSPLLFENSGPTTFVVDQSPVGIDAGYTWASDGYKNVLAATVKVTNGDNADGSEILGLSNKNSKDVWVDADWWFAPESGVTFLDYYGSKDQMQNPGADNQFTYRPKIRRQGVFANYLILNKVDVMGGYMRSKDDWQNVEGVAGGYYRSNGLFAEVNYYVTQLLALSGRYDLIEQRITGGPATQSMHQWNAAVNRSLVRSGAIVARLGWSYLSGRDPVDAVKSTNRLVQADISFNF
jgi:hypothetical protein